MKTSQTWNCEIPAAASPPWHSASPCAPPGRTPDPGSSLLGPPPGLWAHLPGQQEKRDAGLTPCNCAICVSWRTAGEQQSWLGQKLTGTMQGGREGEEELCSGHNTWQKKQERREGSPLTPTRISVKVLAHTLQFCSSPPHWKFSQEVAATFYFQ